MAFSRMYSPFVTFSFYVLLVLAADHSLCRADVPEDNEEWLKFIETLAHRENLLLGIRLESELTSQNSYEEVVNRIKNKNLTGENLRKYARLKGIDCPPFPIQEIPQESQLHQHYERYHYSRDAFGNLIYISYDKEASPESEFIMRCVSYAGDYSEVYYPQDAGDPRKTSVSLHKSYRLPALEAIGYHVPGGLRAAHKDPMKWSDFLRDRANEDNILGFKISEASIVTIDFYVVNDGAQSRCLIEFDMQKGGVPVSYKSVWGGRKAGKFNEEWSNTLGMLSESTWKNVVQLNNVVWIPFEQNLKVLVREITYSGPDSKIAPYKLNSKGKLLEDANGNWPLDWAKLNKKTFQQGTTITKISNLSLVNEGEKLDVDNLVYPAGTIVGDQRTSAPSIFKLTKTTTATDTANSERMSLFGDPIQTPASRNVSSAVNRNAPGPDYTFVIIRATIAMVVLVLLWGVYRKYQH